MTRQAHRFQFPEEDAFDAIVVGAGTGGLTAAALLARSGLRVLVIDQAGVAGGNGTIFERTGYQFDVGLHYVGGCEPGGLIPRVLDRAGAEAVTFEPLDPDGFDTIVLPDLTFRIPSGAEAFRRRLMEYFPSESAGIDRYLEMLRQIREGQRLLARPSEAWRVLPRSSLLLRWAGSTFGAFLNSCTQDPRLQAVLAGQQGDYAEPPSRASVLIAAGLAAHYLDGAWFPRGGGQVLSDRLAEAIERHRGKILLKTWVRRILVERGRAVGVEIEAGRFGRQALRAPVVVSNADYKRTLLELIDPRDVASRTRRRVLTTRMAQALGIVYLGLRRDLLAEGHPRTNYWVYPRYNMDPEYDAVRAGAMPDPQRALLFVTLASLKDPTNEHLAPPGITNVQVISLAPCQPESWGVTEDDVASGTYRNHPAYLRAKEAYGDLLVATARRHFPWMRDPIVFREVGTPLTVRRYTASSDGTSYGLAPTAGQFLWRRPGPTTEIAGLYLCGASGRFGHGIGGVMTSGVAAASAVVGASLMRDLLAPIDRR